MAVTAGSVLKQSFKFSLVNVLAKSISFPVNIIIAAVVAPGDYGVISLVGLWTLYFTYINPGLVLAASREIPHRLGQKDETGASFAQNLSFTTDLAWISVAAIAYLLSAFLRTDMRMRGMFILGAVAFFVTSIQSDLFTYNYARQNFSKAAKANVIGAIVAPLVTVGALYFLNIFAIPLGTIVGALATIAYYSFVVGTRVKLTFQLAALKRLLCVGIPLSLLRFAYWGYRLVDRTIVANFLPMEQLGLYTYALNMATSLFVVFGDFSSVLQPMIWKRMSEHEGHIHDLSEIRSVVVYLSLGVAVAISLLQLAFFALTHLVVRKYTPAIPVFYLLAFNEVFLIVGSIPSTIMLSSRVNQQTLNTMAWVVGLVLNAFAGYEVVHLGYGIIGIACVTIGTQLLLALTLFILVRDKIAPSRAEFMRLLGVVFAPLAVSAALTACFYFGLSLRPVPYVVYGLVLVLVVWVAVIGLFYRTYVSVAKIRSLYRSFKGLIAERMGRRSGGNRKADGHSTEP